MQLNHNKIIVEVCLIFGGNFFDKSPTYKNSECRFAYCGLLRSKKLKYKEISMITGFSLPMIKVRLNKHGNYMKFNKDYKEKFTKLLKKNEE